MFNMPLCWWGQPTATTFAKREIQAIFTKLVAVDQRGVLDHAEMYVQQAMYYQ
jgi:hypothetical protein